MISYRPKYVIGGITLGLYVLLLADFILSVCQAFAESAVATIMSVAVFIPFILFVAITIVQIFCRYSLKMKPIIHVMISFAKGILMLFFTWLMGYGVLRADYYQTDGVTDFSSLSCPVYATILVSLFIAFTFICAAFEIAYIMRIVMEENIAKKQAEAAANPAAETDTETTVEVSSETDNSAVAGMDAKLNISSTARESAENTKNNSTSENDYNSR